MFSFANVGGYKSGLLPAGCSRRNAPHANRDYCAPAPLQSSIKPTKTIRSAFTSGRLCSAVSNETMEQIEDSLSETLTVPSAHSCVCCEKITIVQDSSGDRVTFAQDGTSERMEFCLTFTEVFTQMELGCAFFEHCLRRIPLNSLPNRLSLDLPSSPDEPDFGFLTLSWFDSDGNMITDEEQNEMAVFAQDGDAAGRNISSRPLNPEPAQKFGWMRQLLKNCEEKHSNCGRQSSLPEERPSRLLAVGKTGDSHVFIRETSDKTSLRYAALSYPWGEGQDKDFVHRVKTTKSNLRDRMRDGILVSTLPKTLQDAIYLTSELSFQYVFIDALCIVQDDDVEKKREFARLGGYYDCCTLLFYAARAKHGESGMLGTRDVNDSYGAVFKLPYLRAFSGVEERGFIFVCDGSVSDDNEPLDERGWAYQENKLSHRKLKFGSKQTQWECGEYPAGCGHPVDGGSIFGECLSNIPCGDSDGPEFREDKLREWMGHVEEVSQNKFTSYDDKIPALHTLATKFAAEMGYQMSDFWGGIWGPDAIRQLQWQVLKPRKKEEGLGPSWQWKCWESGVQYPPGKFDWKGRKPEIKEHTDESLSIRGFMHMVCVSEGSVDLSGQWITHLGGEASICIYWDYQPQPDDVWLLEFNNTKTWICGLVLQEADDKKDAFVRCGLFYIKFSFCQEERSKFPEGALWDVLIV